jgi:CRISPR system Cascade subunit CasB
MKGETMTDSRVEAFINFLARLADEENRGALAALRRGLGRRPGEAPTMFPYVVPYLPNLPAPEQEAAYYAVAALFALHPTTCQQGNLGNHLASCIKDENARAAIERRFVALLNCHPDDLPDHLRQSISFLRSNEKPVNYTQLLTDLLLWSHPERIVQRRWATGFWGRSAGPVGAGTPPAEPTEAPQPTA